MFAPFEVREDVLMSITPLCARKNHLKDPPLGNFGKRTELNLCPISAQESSEEWTEEDGTQIGLLHLVGRPVTKQFVLTEGALDRRRRRGQFIVSADTN